ncbi:glycosyltransferase [Subsaximicrobium wynnwilliamsii]|uniref:Glycosyltransferase n=1 Tax=Subsaximicrobium wynnwilliamsii TaxID=291179 RepID=A0A5C6ZGN1_9FLAO|nr:glycosyltransferase [Subsaximicrobium wynnwilliamsii]TXD81374.1 glycosyltransferase [Subsaximicrobium wynnwilliamsii]TXD89070.1 glycosyltransferase [Subsaximicrobium wynnwilliamsii]TXE00748.1 glycosyltransferase [Subsaximicrobium wynnwilliamsii]
MHRKKILITIDWFLPGTKSGGPVRSYANLIEHLNEGFEFYIVTRNTDFGSTESYESITPNVWTRFNAYTQVFYCSADYLSKTHLKTLFETTEFDFAYINGIYSWYFSILPVMLLKKSNKPIIVSARGMLNPQAFSVKPFKKKLFINIAKGFRFYTKIQFHATNTEEAIYIKQIIGSSTNVKVAPNLPRAVNTSAKPKVSKQHPVRFVNLARVSIEKGTLTMLNALRHVKASLILDLFGPIYDTAYWEKCQTVIAALPDSIEVNYKGVLDSEEVPELLRGYDFFVLLSEGENFGHAILEALSAGIPVLISDQTPWRNLTSQSVGWDLNLNDEETIIRAFETAITMNDENYTKWSQAAFHYAKEVIENPKVLEQNKALFLNA